MIERKYETETFVMKNQDCPTSLTPITSKVFPVLIRCQMEKDAKVSFMTD